MSHVSMGSGLENMNIFILKHKWAYKAACFEAWTPPCPTLCLSYCTLIAVTGAAGENAPRTKKNIENILIRCSSEGLFN